MTVYNSSCSSWYSLFLLMITLIMSGDIYCPFIFIKPPQPNLILFESGSSELSLSFFLPFFFVALQKKQLLCPAAEFVLRDYTVRLSGTWQGFVVSHTFLDNMADLLIWHGVHPCHLITGRTLILKRQHPKYEEDRCLQRETIHTVWIPRQMVHAWKMSNTRQYILQYVQA